MKITLNKVLIGGLLLSIALGIVSDMLYRNSSKNAINIENFQLKLNNKAKDVDALLEKTKKIIQHSSVDSLSRFAYENNDASIYVFENNELVFWSDYKLDITKVHIHESDNWQFIQLPNAYCIGRTLNFESIKLLAIINIKNNFSYENEVLINEFSPSFGIPKNLAIEAGKTTDKHAVFSLNGEYLFSLSESETPLLNETWSVLGMISFSFSFLLFFILYVRVSYIFNTKVLRIKTFLFTSISVGILISLVLYFNIPGMLFWNKIFTAYQYASNPLLASICHLTIATAYFISTIYLFYFHVSSKTKKTFQYILQSVVGLYFLLLYYLLSGLIFHSSIQLNILNFNDFSIISIWTHVLILIWGIGLVLLFYKTHNFIKAKKQLTTAIIVDVCISVILYIAGFSISTYYALPITFSFLFLIIVFYLPVIFPKFKNIYGLMASWIFAYTLFVLFNSYQINNEKKADKYKILAQNISINGNTENDRMAELLLEDLDNQIVNDKIVGELTAIKDSLATANNYLNKNYLRGFWNKYDMRLNQAQKNSELYAVYENFISTVGTQIKKTHFYSVPTNESNMSYIGKFYSNSSKNDTSFFYMEFYPRSQYKSYSFPNLLMASAPNIQSQLKIAIAKYEYKKLVYSSEKLEFPLNSNWIPKNKSEFFSIINNNQIHYIYAPNNYSYIIITELQPYEPFTYIFYFGYTFLAYFAFCILLIWLYNLKIQRGIFRIGMASKFQYAFLALLLISFLMIFYVSVNFIQKKYREEQLANLENKKKYIQKALQDIYYWNEDLSSLNMQTLNFDLQDLSYLYHTDIHVYNNYGVLVGSSQPIIFNRNLISNRIAPTPFFKSKANINLYEQIGKLKFLTGYTDFYNGDYLQIGYIAIPQFFSQDEIKNEIQSFVAVIIHIYLIIIILAILISIFIGKQISAPLIILENKLKDMRVGRRNEKIDYKFNDEIGQLVIQYNLAVDELEKSAKLLAQSERETAWKSMARQVAHEINNPLTPMKLSIQQLQRTKNMNDKGFDEYFEKSTVMLIEQIDNLSRIAGTFSDFARMPEAKFERVDIAAKLYSVVKLFSNNNEQIKIKFLGKPMDVFVYADPKQLVQVFNNLIKNAIQSIPNLRNGKIQIGIEQIEDQIVISIIDNGIGIDAESQDKIFNPNFTTKSTGMGLGLAISKNIIELSGGSINFTTKINKGTTFTITLPIAN